MTEDHKGRDTGSPVVLVGFAESLAAIETIWDLLDHGFDVHAFTRTGRRPAIARDKRVSICEITAPEIDLEQSVKDLREVVSALGVVPLLMPLDDAAVLSIDLFATAEGSERHVVGPCGAAARLCLDKRLQLQAADESGLTVPQTVVVEPGDVTAAGPCEPPWIVKPALALDVVDGRVIKGPTSFVDTAADLRASLKRRRDPVLVQGLVRGVGRGVFGLAHGSRAHMVSGHERVRMMNPSGSGSSACRSLDPAPDLVSGVERFIAITGWSGMFMMEFLTDLDGTPWFMELNGRPWGSMALAIDRGLHYPAWSTQLTLDADGPIPDLPLGPHLTSRHLGRELLHLAFVARGRREVQRRRRAEQPIDPDLNLFPTMASTARDVMRWRRGQRLYNAQRGQLRVLAVDTVDTIRDVVRPRGGGR